MFEKDNQGKFIKFDKEAYKRDSMELFLYSVLKTFENKAGFTSISVKQLIEYASLGRSLVYKIEQALTNLIEQKLITVYDAIDFGNIVEMRNIKPSDMFYIKVSEMVANDDSFIQIYTSEILRFISEKMKGTKVDIFKQFIYILKFVNQGNGYRKISFPNISTIAKDINVSDRSVKNYTKILEEHSFLYSNILIIEKEKMKKVYSRPQHSQDVDDAITECIAKQTKEINIKRPNNLESKSKETLVSSKRKARLKDPEQMLSIDKKIRDVFSNYQGEFNDNSIRQLKKYQEQHESEVLVKALHIIMDGKTSLNNPTGFILKALKDSDAIKEAECRIKRSKEQSERMDKEDKVPSFDYHKVWKAMKKKQQEKKGKENNQGGQERKAISEIEVLLEEPKVKRLNQVGLYPYMPEWKREGFSSREDYEKAMEAEKMKKLLASLQIS